MTNLHEVNMRFRRPFLLLTTLFVLTNSVSTEAAPRPSSTTCSRTGATRTSSNQRQVCVLVAGKRYWVNDPRFVSSPSSTMSPPSAQQIRPGGELSNSDLRGLNLAGRDLSTARAARSNLEGVNLAGAFIMSLNFASSNLRRADLSQTNGGWVYFNGANLEGATLTGARLRASNFDAYVDNMTIRVNLRDARLDSADLSWSTFENADLTGAYARNASFVGANFQQSKVLRADLSNADFQGADLSGADFTGSTLSANWRNSFSGARFSNTTWIDGSVWSSMPTTP